jgi:type I restriction enzyme S subunit
MPNNWKTYKLSDALEIKYGKDHKKVQAGNIPIYGTGGIMRYGNQALYDKETILIPRKGSLNNIFYLNEPFWSVDTIFWSKINEDVAFPKYLFYNLKVLDFASMDVGSAIPSLTTELLKKIEIELPSLPEQQSIASILSAIDDKIENNLAINKTLEEMAMALYKHWFVDFGPFQDGEFVESELGLIPKGWEVKRLDDLINVVSKGTTPRMKDVAGLEIKIPFLKVKDVNTDGEINTNNIDLIPEEIHLKDLKRSILYENDLLFSIAGTIGRVSIVTKHLDNSNCNQALAFIRLKDKEKFKSFIYYWLKSDEIQNRIQNSVVQGVQANISLTVLKDLKLPISSDYGIIEKYSGKVNPILELILQNQEENRLLRTQRDTLLPQLISGAVRLKEFQEKTENIM